MSSRTLIEQELTGLAGIATAHSAASLVLLGIGGGAVVSEDEGAAEASQMKRVLVSFVRWTMYDGAAGNGEGK